MTRRTESGIQLTSILLGLTLLMLRSPSVGAIPLAVGAGAIGGVAPITSTPGSGALKLRRWVFATALGVSAMAVIARLSSGPHVAVSAVAIGASTIAAIAEELLFRRLVYGWLLRWGAAVAVGGAAVAFALIHIPAYGLGTFGINLAVGLLLGWQRYHSGSWTSPAATHVIGNLLATLG